MDFGSLHDFRSLLQEEEVEVELSVPEVSHNQELRVPATSGELGHVFLVHNEVHSSSCVLHFLQCGLNRPRMAALLELFNALCR